MGSFFSLFFGKDLETKTSTMTLYITPDDYKLLEDESTDLLEIITNSNCQLSDRDKERLQIIQQNHSYRGGKSRKHRNYKKRTKKRKVSL